MNSQSSTRIIKIPANQSAPYLVGSNRVNVTIPKNNIINMLQSYLEAQVRISTTDGDVGSGNGTYNVNLHYGADTSKPLYTVGLVRNCRLSSDQMGILEETQNVNLLRTSLNHLTLSRNEQLSLQVNSTRQVYDRHKLKIGGLFRKLQGEGTIKSSDQLARIPIHLNQLFGLARASEVDLNKLGSLDIEVELDISNINAEIIGKYPAKVLRTVGGDVDEVELQQTYPSISAIPFEVGDKVDLRQDNGSTLLNYKNITDVQLNFATSVATITLDSTTGGALTDATLRKVVIQNAEDVGGATTDYVLKQKYQRLDGCPFFVNQKIRVTQTEGSIEVGLGLITGISRSVTSGVVTISTDVNSGGAVSDLDIEVYVPDATTAVISYEGLSAVIYQKMEKTIDDSAGYQYMTFETERKNGNNNTSYNDTFNLRPACVNSFLMFDNGTLYSVNDNAQSYRQILNNTNLTDRPVEFLTPLYYDNILKTIINGGRKLRCLQNITNANKRDVDTAEDDESQEMKIVTTPTPATVGNKLLQINVEATNTGVQNVVCFKENMRVIGA